MRNLNIALRSLFKKERHNMTKILSLSVGLAVALVLIAKICFERSFDSFYPDVERVYRLVEYGSMNGGDPFEFSQTPGAVAPAMKEEVPGIEAATRLTYVTGKGTRITAGDKRRYLADNVLMADSCLFDVLPRPVLSGDPKKVLARPGYAMISRPRGSGGSTGSKVKSSCRWTIPVRGGSWAACSRTCRKTRTFATIFWCRWKAWPSGAGTTGSGTIAIWGTSGWRRE